MIRSEIKQSEHGEERQQVTEPPPGPEKNNILIARRDAYDDSCGAGDDITPQ